MRALAEFVVLAGGVTLFVLFLRHGRALSRRLLGGGRKWRQQLESLSNGDIAVVIKRGDERVQIGTVDPADHANFQTRLYELEAVAQQQAKDMNQK